MRSPCWRAAAWRRAAPPRRCSATWSVSTWGWWKRGRAPRSRPGSPRAGEGTRRACVAAGLLAYATFMTAIFQSLFAAFIRMRYQRTWEGQLTTQVELTHVVWGEVLWAGLLATMYVVIVWAVRIVIQWAGLLALALRWLPVLWPITFVAGCGFAALGLCFTPTVPTIHHLNLPACLPVLPI